MGWTDEQGKAIASRGGSLLVSAAAGSGKTSVLVERIVQRIIDKNNPCDVDELLVVTFAKDAAAEMKERIYNRLRELLDENPEDVGLVRQQLILPRAKICTIDSFFGEVVRNNASFLGVSADYKTVTGVEYDAYVMQAIKLALDEVYSIMPEGFSELVELVSSGRDDGALEQTIKRIYESIDAYPFPLRKLDEFLDMYTQGCDVQNSPWGRLILDYCRSGIEYVVKKLEGLYSDMRMEGEIFDAYCSVLSSEIATLNELVGSFDALTWDEIALRLNAFELVKPSEAGIRSHPLKIRGTAVRKDCREILSKLCEGFVFVSNDEFEQHRQKCLPIVSALTGVVKIFTVKLREIMNEDNVLGFNDIQHLTVRALCEPDGLNVRRTEIAKEMAGRFKEILIDEYQDVNEVQHMIFSAISDNDSNIFRVGDIKQSIYGFRQAMPHIFLGMRNSFSPYSAGQYPAKIILDRNFRSGKAVVDTVNFCFRMLMSHQVGGIAYDNEDELVNQAKYTTARQSEFDIVSIPKGEKSDFVQAEFIADRIKSIMSSGQQVTDKKGNKRPVQFKDFTILLRAAKKRADNYVEVLKSRGINVVYELSGDFFACEEIMIMMSLLRVIDNPLLDVELMSVMFSPLYGFLPDDAARIRMSRKNSSLYSAVSLCAQQGDERCKRLIDDIARYRLVASTVTSDDLIRRIYDATSFEALCRAMGNGEQRIANLMLLSKYAQDFENNGFKGLSAFVRFMEKLEEGDGKVEASLDSTALDNAVRIMTIHKSKGLEFPYCIIAGLDVDFNRMPLNSGIITHSELGIGLDLRDVDTLMDYSTAQRAAVRQAIVNEEMAEQLRVLYVAMTRAKEKLIMVTAAAKPEELVEKHRGAECGKKLDRFKVWSSNDPASLILPCLLSHPVGGMVCNYDSAFEMDNDNDGSAVPFAVNIIGKGEETEVIAQPEEQAEEIEIPPELEEQIGHRLNYEYKYLPLSKTVSKTTASSLKARAFDKEFFATDIPAFMAKSGMTAAQRGTAAHRFLECCDYSRCDDLKSEASRLVQNGRLTQEQVDAIDFNLLKSFFESELFARLLRSPSVSREYNFAVNISVRELYPDLPDEFKNELVMVQGAVDCFFEEDGEIVIIDYKTDRVSRPEQLTERYTDQLRLYRSAIEQITEKRVKECVLFSVSLGKTVEI